jgi:hypothetical protein
LKVLRIKSSGLLREIGNLVGLLWWGIGPSQGLCLHRTAQHQKTRAYTHAMSGIRSHDPTVRAVQVHIRPRQRGHWDRQ